MSVQQFSAIFDGLQEAYGTYRVDKQQSNGKNTGKAAIVREQRTAKMWREHLSGKGASLGIIPINAENKCKWGCVDVDQYPLDHKQLVEKIRRLKLPLVVCRSKSGGAHCFLFSVEWVEASDMQKSLQNIAAALGYGGSEVFPKQVKLHLDRGDVGKLFKTYRIITQKRVYDTLFWMMVRLLRLKSSLSFTRRISKHQNKS